MSSETGGREGIPGREGSGCTALRREGERGRTHRKSRTPRVQGRVAGRGAHRGRGRHSGDAGVCVETAVGNSGRAFHGGGIIWFAVLKDRSGCTLAHALGGQEGADQVPPEGAA